MMNSYGVYLITNLDEHAAIAVADSMEVAEQLVAQFEEEDIKDSGCEYDYSIDTIPFFSKGIETVV